MLKGLIACGTVITLLLAGLGWQTWQLGQARTEAGVVSERLETCRQATHANLANLQELERELAECVGETTVVESELAVDAVRRAHQVEQLQGRVASLQAALRESAAADDCAGLPVPAAAAERLLDAADRAHRAGGEDGQAVGTDPG